MQERRLAERKTAIRTTKWEKEQTTSKRKKQKGKHSNNKLHKSRAEHDRTGLGQLNNDKASWDFTLRSLVLDMLQQIII